MALKPMTKTESKDITPVYYIMNNKIHSIPALMKNRVPTSTYREIRDQIICDYWFGETYMLRKLSKIN